MYEELFEFGEDDEEVRRRLIYWLEEYWQGNQEKIESLGKYFFAGAVTLLLQLVFWSWALAATVA